MQWASDLAAARHLFQPVCFCQRRLFIYPYPRLQYLIMSPYAVEAELDQVARSDRTAGDVFYRLVN